MVSAGRRPALLSAKWPRRRQRRASAKGKVFPDLWEACGCKKPCMRHKKTERPKEGLPGRGSNAGSKPDAPGTKKAPGSKESIRSSRIQMRLKVQDLRMSAALSHKFQRLWLLLHVEINSLNKHEHQESRHVKRQLTTFKMELGFLAAIRPCPVFPARLEPCCLPGASKSPEQQACKRAFQRPGSRLDPNCVSTEVIMTVLDCS